MKSIPASQSPLGSKSMKNSSPSKAANNAQWKIISKRSREAMYKYLLPLFVKISI
jgi:hypothetical protein